jgi:hypothetical protein
MHNVKKLNQPDQCTIPSFKFLKNVGETKEPNYSKVKKGEFVFLREFGLGFRGGCEIANDWVNDPEARDKHNVAVRWYSINVDVKGWNVMPPYEVIRLR